MTYIILENAAKARIALHAAVTQDDIGFDKIVGKGAVGTVYHAEIQRKPVAVKVTRESNIAFVEEEFLLEVALMCVLSHPHLLPCLGASLEGPDYFIVSPYQGRGSLRMVLSDPFEPMNWVRKLSVATMIAEGVKFMHSKYVMHRDLKSENVLVGYDWNACLADFGSAQFFKSRKTRKESLIGTAGKII